MLSGSDSPRQVRERFQDSKVVSQLSLCRGGALDSALVRAGPVFDLILGRTLKRTDMQQSCEALHSQLSVFINNLPQFCYYSAPVPLSHPKSRRPMNIIIIAAR